MRNRPRIVISNFDNPGNRHYAGGGGAVAEMIADWLAADFDVTLLTAGPRSGCSDRGGVHYRYLPLTWAGPRAGQLLFHAALPWAVRRIPHDLWIESFTPPFSTSFLPLFSPAQVVGFAQNLSGEEMWGKYRIPFFLLERLGLRFYRDLIVLTPADGETVSRYSKSASVRVIPNSVDLPEVDEATIGSGDYILFIGRIDIWHKGLDLLLQAYHRAGIDMPLMIAGSGTSEDERKLATLRARFGGKVNLLGRVTGDAKRELLQRSAFVVLPSRHEAFGLAALEGMAYGKAVVHFDLPTLRWMDGDVRVRPFDLDAFAGQLRLLAGDARTRRDLGRTAHAAAQQYGLEEMKRHYRTFAHQALAVTPT